MNSNNKSEIKVGITVFIGTLLLVWLIIWVKNVSIFSHNKEILIEFSSVPGLSIGDPVTINGVREGEVEKIKLNNNSVTVTIKIPDNIHLKSDATFSLLMLDMMGGKKISIKQGISQSELNYSEVQSGYFPGDISTAVAALNSVQSDLVTMVRDAKVTLGLVNDLMAKGDIKREILISLKGLQDLTANITSVIDKNKHNFNMLMANGSKFAESANEVVQENKSQIPVLLKKIGNLTDKSKTMIVSITEMLNETKTGKNNIGKLLYDKQMYFKLKTTLSQLQELTKIFTEQLKKDGLNVDAHIF